MYQKTLVFICIFLFFINSCKKIINSEIARSPGPSSCLANRNEILSTNIVRGQVVDNTTVPSGRNTVGIVLPLGNSMYVVCTGTVVADNLILTAAHCLDDIDHNNVSPGHIVFSDQLNFSRNSVVSSPITCWQKHGSYTSCADTNSLGCTLFDIAWLKIGNSATANYGYNTISVLANPQLITATESKWMFGFGHLSDSQSNTSNRKYSVMSASSINFPDTIPGGAITNFNAITFNNAYQSYLTVIGPNNQPGSAKGTCMGDSGGPVYLNRNGNYILAALTQGSNSVLTPHPTNTAPPYSFNSSQYALCNDGYGVYTTIGNYINWIQTSSGVTLSLF